MSDLLVTTEEKQFIKKEFQHVENIGEYTIKVLRYNKLLKIDARELLQDVYTDEYCESLEETDKNINNIKVLSFSNNNQYKTYAIEYNIFFNHNLPVFIKTIISNMPINKLSENGIINYVTLTKKSEIRYNLLSKFNVDFKMVYKFNNYEGGFCNYDMFILYNNNCKRPLVHKFINNQMNSKIDEIFKGVQRNIRKWVEKKN